MYRAFWVTFFGRGRRRLGLAPCCNSLRLVSRRVECEVFTAVDGGRDPVAIQCIHGEGPQMLSLLRTVGLSGFRMDAAIRHLCNTTQRTAVDQAILLLTDSASGMFHASYGHDHAYRDFADAIQGARASP